MFKSCESVLLWYHFPPLCGKKIAYTKTMTSRHLVFFCRIKPWKKRPFCFDFSFFRNIACKWVPKSHPVKPKHKHCDKQISQQQKEKDNSKKSRWPFKQMPHRRAPLFLLSPGINTQGNFLRLQANMTCSLQHTPFFVSLVLIAEHPRNSGSHVTVCLPATQPPICLHHRHTSVK